MENNKIVCSKYDGEKLSSFFKHAQLQEINTNLDQKIIMTSNKYAVRKQQIILFLYMFFSQCIIFLMLMVVPILTEFFGLNSHYTRIE